jgi:hypothetical protein
MARKKAVQVPAHSRRDSFRPAYSRKVRKLVAAPADEIFRVVRSLIAASSDFKLDQFADNASIDSKEPFRSRQQIRCPQL